MKEQRVGLKQAHLIGRKQRRRYCLLKSFRTRLPLRDARGLRRCELLHREQRLVRRGRLVPMRVPRQHVRQDLSILYVQPLPLVAELSARFRYLPVILHLVMVPPKVTVGSMDLCDSILPGVKAAPPSLEQ